MSASDEVLLDGATVTAALADREKALALAQAAADDAATDDDLPPTPGIVVQGGPGTSPVPGTKLGAPAAATATAVVDDPQMSVEGADTCLQLAGSWLMPSEGLWSRFNEEERKQLSPHVSKLWNKWLPYIELKWKDEALAVVCLATIIGARKTALAEIEAKKKKAEELPPKKPEAKAAA